MKRKHRKQLKLEHVLVMGALSLFTSMPAWSDDWTSTTTSVSVPAGTHVGIGTSTPGYPLDVRGVSVLGGKTIVTGSTAGEEAFVVKQSMTTGAIAHFRNSSATMVIIDNAGQVGIGTTIPAANLDVNGQAILRGATTLTNRLLLNSNQGDDYNPQVQVSMSPDNYHGAGIKLISNNGDYSEAMLHLTRGSGSINPTNGSFLKVTDGESTLFRIRPDGTVETKVLLVGGYANFNQSVSFNSDGVDNDPQLQVRMSPGKYYGPGLKMSSFNPDYSDAILHLTKSAGNVNSVNGSYFKIDDGTSTLFRVKGDGAVSIAKDLAVDGEIISLGGNSNNGIINNKFSMRVNIDADNNHTDESFIIGNNQESINQNNVLFKVQENGSVGIGTSSPQAKLDVWGTARIHGAGNTDFTALQLRASSANGDIVKIAFTGDGNGNYAQIAGQATGKTVDGGTANLGKLIFRTRQGGDGEIGNMGDRMVINHRGQVGIGVNDVEGDYNLQVAGSVKINSSLSAETIKTRQWAIETPDYVFEKDYKLTSLPEVEKFVKANKHLPEIPNDKQFKKDGMNVGEMNMRLLKKVEELTLYAIDQEKRVREQERRDLKLEEEIRSLRKIIHQLAVKN